MKKTLFLIAALAVVFCSAAFAQVAISTFAGNGSAAYAGDGSAATAASLNTPYGVAVDAIGNVYIADYANSVIRRIDTFGIIHTVAGTGVSGFSGDGGPATAARLDHPRGIATDAAGNVYFSDYANLRIRKISTSGTISTIAGTGFAAYSGDGGPATAAAINYAWGLAIDATGNIYIADQNNCRIRKINTAGIITTIAGTGVCFISGDGGPATAAQIQLPLGVACDGAGNIFIADYGNNRIRKVNPAGTISTIAGSPTYGFTGDGGPSTAARLYYPEAIATDATGNIYISDINNSRIREISTAGIINTIVGNGSDGFSGDGGPPTLAEINRSTGVAVGPGGKIYISDNNNNRIRVVKLPGHAPYFTHGHTQHITSCPTEGISLDSLLTIFDIDTGQTETWSVLAGPSHGLLVASYTATSSGNVITPSGLSYAPMGYTGNDSFKIRINDGAFSDTTTIYITILSLPNAGAIAGVDSICPGDTVLFTDTVAGGAWGTGSSAIATVSSSGLVTGIAPGTNSITYSVTNMCGTTTATFSLIVRSDCPAGVLQVEKAGNGLQVFPNPANDVVTITIIGNWREEAQCTITDMTGREMQKFKTYTSKPAQVALYIPAGIYYCTALTPHATYIARITVVK